MQGGVVVQAKYKVLHIFSGYGGGISSLILNLIENKLNEFQMDLLAFSYKNGEDFVERVSLCGVKCYTMPRPSEKGYIKFFRYVNALLKKEQYHAVHCHIAGFHAIPFEFMAKKNKIKVFILHAHTTHFDSKVDRNRITYSIGQYYNYKKTTCYMTCSDMAARYVFGEKYLKKRSAYLIPNGIKKENFRQILSKEEKESYRKEFDINKETDIILHVGRFSTPKNHDFILNIVKELNVEKNNFVVLLVGSGELFDEVKSKIYKLHLEEKIKLLGRRLDVSKLMQFADYMILPSFYEGLPTVAVECQASGTRILMSDKITKQCDMGLGLVDFLSINSVQPWVNELKKSEFKHLSTEQCVDAIEKKGVTAFAAGRYYCDILKKTVEGCK